MNKFFIALTIFLSQQLFAQTSIVVNPASQDLSIKPMGMPNSDGKIRHYVSVGGIEMGNIYLNSEIVPNRLIQNAKTEGKLLTLDFETSEIKMKDIAADRRSEEKIALIKCIAQRDQIEALITDYMTNQNNSGRSTAQERQPLQRLEQTSDLDSLYFR
ncbi:MAG: hypothetical protein COW01_04645 [Bdellovibrionales bacterium CG12_big_fil_rev_8_21_14_0_65_38_15]|nr:MAG: hypothetical protein COW79_11965 [Bdellovibrionales bacterium CG22_combo_CG10-13_8_21_14_all_38_13]PIQ56346.1 MAG: hypothetical protein COW01_04645 [Bdellovibrionales bacterium CG12_big_fil_rev_8_21_14_0_65_38_15]PIR29377.1 MAG: hypothetical protein COV38_11580 [Bdellovibrionales bacterium CG11_big_fil_rev_8_21_14_0_20_38_13]